MRRVFIPFNSSLLPGAKRLSARFTLHMIPVVLLAMATTLRGQTADRLPTPVLNPLPSDRLLQATTFSSLRLEQIGLDTPDTRQETSSVDSRSEGQAQATDAGSTNDTGKPTGVVARYRKPHDFNEDIYHRNRLEFAVDVGWHPVNIPFIYDFAVGDSYNMTPLKYTLVPMIASLRWHVTNVGWPWIFRGNMDFTFSGSVTAIPRGPETHYYAFMFGIRRNFVHRNWKAVPFFEQRGGAGLINAKEPLGVVFAQGQNLTFTYNLGVGVRYNFDTKYSVSAGMNYMHISNGYLSEPKFANYGINVYGPMVGFDMRLGKPRHQESQ